MWDNNTDSRSNQNVEGLRLIDYENGLEDDLEETFNAQNSRGANKSSEDKKGKQKKSRPYRAMNGQGSSSHMTSPVSGSGRPSVERFPSYSSDVEAANFDGKFITNVETEENIKCIVTSSLFVAIIILLFVMMFTINPAE